MPFRRRASLHRRSRFVGRLPPSDRLLTERPEDRQGLGLEAFGRTGVKRYGRRIADDEFDPRVRGPKAAKKYREMVDNSAGLGGAILLIQSLLSQVELRWEVPEDCPDPVASEALLKFLESCWNDLETPHAQWLSELFMCVVHGFSVMETMYKIRRGDSSEPLLRSKYSDGRIGWRDFEPRAADSVEEWLWEDNRVVGFWQRVEGETGDMYVPLSKCIHVTLHGNSKRSPEGRSMLRSAVRAYHFKTVIEEYEAIGIERNLDGLPIARVPARMLSQHASDEEKAQLAYIVRLVQRVRRDENDGVVFPSETSPNGQPSGFDFSVLSTGVDPSKADPVLQRYTNAELMALLSEVIALGSGSVGSWALASSKTSTLALVLGAILNTAVDAFNGQEVPRILRMNGMNPAVAPRLVPGDIETQPLEELAAFLGAMATAGALTPDDKLEEHLRRLAGLPPIDRTSDARTPALGPHSAEEEKARGQEEAIHEDATGEIPFATTEELRGSLPLREAAAAMGGISSGTVGKLIRSGKLAGLRVPGGWRVSPRAIEEYLAGLQAPAAPAPDASAIDEQG